MNVRTRLASWGSAGALIVGSVLGANVAAADDSATTYDDREVVSGLLFGTGEFAAEINNAVTTDDAAALSAYEEAAAVSLDEFFVAEPAAIESIVDDIQSGDVNQVDAGLDELASTYTAHVKNEIGEKEFAAVAADNGVSPQACGVAIACVAYAALAVHNTVAVTALAAAVVGGAVACGAWWVDCSSGSAAVTAASSRAAMDNFVVDVTRAARD